MLMRQDALHLPLLHTINENRRGKRRVAASPRPEQGRVEGRVDAAEATRQVELESHWASLAEDAEGPQPARRQFLRSLKRKMSGGEEDHVANAEGMSLPPCVGVPRLLLSSLLNTLHCQGGPLDSLLGCCFSCKVSLIALQHVVYR